MTPDSAREVIAWWLGKAYPSGAGQFDLAHDLLTALQSAGYAVVPVGEANAHLIAAELYEALAAMVARYASTDTWEVPVDCDVAARAALAKARGEPRPTKTEGEG